MRRKFCYLAVIMFFSSSYVFSQNVPSLDISLAQSEKQAESNSPKLKSAMSDKSAAEQRALQQKTQLFPRLAFDGTYRYNTTVPEINFPIPGSQPQKFGDNTNYSYGILGTWTVWDKGSTNNLFFSASMLAEAKSREVEALKKQLILSVRSSYLQVALAGEHVMLLVDALQLAEAEYNDIKLNVRAGTKSRMDELLAHQEVLGRMKQLRQARADLALSLRELFSVTGEQGYNYDLSLPLDSRSGQKLPGGVSAPTVIIKLESIDSLLEKFRGYENLKLNETHPSLESLTKSIEAGELLTKSQRASAWPRIQLIAKTSIDYPLGTKLESFNQNTIGANLGFPLFESGLTAKKARETEFQHSSNMERREQLKKDFARDWSKTVDQLANLDEQRKLNEISVKETQELSEIIYQAYQIGSTSYLEVQNANFKALESKIQSASIKVQIMMNLALLDNLGD